MVVRKASHFCHFRALAKCLCRGQLTGIIMNATLHGTMDTTMSEAFSIILRDPLFYESRCVGVSYMRSR